MLRKVTLLSALFIVCFLHAQDSIPTGIEGGLHTLSFEELLNVIVETGNLTGIETKKSPAAITVITEHQIQTSSARNLALLLEQYVPSMVLMTHSEGDKIGIRGQIAAENYKLLLLINGQNVTNMTYEGVIAEIDNWDLSDIERVEVIRGPGSVTYGSGAVAGVINIITKTPNENSAGLTVNVKTEPLYRNYGGSLQFNKTFGKVGVYSYGSVYRTLGWEDPLYYKPSASDTTENRYVGLSPGQSPAQPHMADGLDRPQIKLHTHINIGDNFHVWTRYNQSGQTHHYRSLVEFEDSLGNITESTTGRHVTQRSFSIFPTYKLKLGEHSNLKTTLGYNTQEYLRTDYLNPNYPIDHSNQIRDYAFSQSQLSGEVLYELNNENNLRFVTGLKYNHTAIQSPWGRSQDYMLIREGGYIINDTNTNVYYQSDESSYNKSRDVTQVGDGIFVNTLSYMLEAHYQISSKIGVLASARIDKPSISPVQVSPRLALVSELSHKNFLRLNAQRSIRMMPLRAQYLYQQNNADSTEYQNEGINSIELLYTRVHKENMIFNLSAYYNHLNLVGYTGNDLQFLGKQQLAGLEAEGKYQNDFFKTFISHSYLLPISFDYNEDLATGNNRNNITYSDYYYIRDNEGFTLELNSYGNGINNWSNHITKFSFEFSSKKLRSGLTLNGVMNWGYKGSYDEMEMYAEAYESIDVYSLTTEEQLAYQEHYDRFLTERELLDDQNIYKSNFLLNASVHHTIEVGHSDLIITAFVTNLLDTYKRYYVSTGSGSYYPSRFQFMDEPTVVGCKVELNLL